MLQLGSMRLPMQILMKIMSTEKLALNLCVISVDTVSRTEWKPTPWTSGDMKHDVEHEEYRAKNLQVIKDKTNSNIDKHFDVHTGTSSLFLVLDNNSSILEHYRHLQLDQ